MTVNWHERYLEQAGWTRSTREYLLSEIGFARIDTILDVGCGTGALHPEFAGKDLTGVDLDLSNLRVANLKVKLVQADGLQLPFGNDSFDLAFCHFVLLWLREPVRFLYEMKRVVKPNGIIAILAEPDYAARIDHPLSRVEIGHMQNSSLNKQGIDLEVGRKIGGYLTQIGCREIVTGVIGGEWGHLGQALSQESQVLESDLQMIGINPQPNSSFELGFSYIPTFYALGRC